MGEGCRKKGKKVKENHLNHQVELGALFTIGSSLIFFQLSSILSVSSIANISSFFLVYLNRFVISPS